MNGAVPMPYAAIHSLTTGKILHDGSFQSIKACAEDAAQSGIPLDGADMRRANLINAALDGARLRGARFDGANLMGANLSEADLSGTNFRDAGLQNACLCFSTMNDCAFTGASFGGTDIAGAHIAHGLFDTLSAFTLNFRDAAQLSGCRFKNPDETLCLFSRPPVVLAGLQYPVILMDRHIKIGAMALSHDDWRRYANDNRPHRRLDEGSLHAFIGLYGHTIDALIRAARPGEAISLKNVDIK